MERTTRTTVTKTAAVTGFIALIAFFVWLAVQIASLVPSAFSSLASLADSVYNNRPSSQIVVGNPNTIVNTGESFTITWTDLNREGSYTFSYLCVDGVAVDVRTSGSRIETVTCGETLTLGEAVTSLEVLARSEQRRFTDINYIIGFIPAGATEASISTTATLTVVNANIPQSQSGVATPEPEAEAPVEEPAGEVAGETTDTPATPTRPGTPTVIETPIFALPVSNPNGFVDLAVRYLAVGTMDADNDFTPRGTIDEDVRGAFQFEVRNLGTKTSDEWTFTATFTSGTTYESKTQAGLKPNERSIITLGFDYVGERGAQTFGASIDVDDDINPKNDSFTWAVNIVE